MHGGIKSGRGFIADEARRVPAVFVHEPLGLVQCLADVFKFVGYNHAARKGKLQPRSTIFKYHITVQ